MNLYLRLVEWLRREEGQDLVEYALILGLIAVAATALIIAVGANVETIWTNVSAAVGLAAAAAVP